MTAPRRVRTYLRGPVLVFLVVWVVTAAQGLAMVVTRSERWSGHWPSTSAAVTWAVLFGSAVAAAAAAWVMAAPRRDGYQSLLAGSSRSTARVYARGLLAVAAGNLAGYLVVVGYLATVTTPLATRDGLNPLELLPVIGSVPAAVAVGAALGRVAPPMLAPVAAAVLPYLGYGFSAYADAYLDRTLFVDLLAVDQTARDYLAAPRELLLLKGGVGLAVGAALLGWVLGARRLAYQASIATGLILTGLMLIAGVRVEVPDAYRVVCTGAQPVACVDRAHDHLLATYQEQISLELAKLAGLDLSGAAFIQSEALTPPELEVEMVVVVPIVSGNTEPAHQIDRRMFTALFGYSLFERPCQPTGRPDGLVLYDWWLTRNGLPTDGSNFPGEPPVALIIADDPQLMMAREEFGALAPAARERWFADFGLDAVTCAATVDRG